LTHYVSVCRIAHLQGAAVHEEHRAKRAKVVESRAEPLQNIHASPLRPLRLGEKNISRKLLFSRKAAEGAKASQRLSKGLAWVGNG
jgi:hypothetical protein